MQGILLMVLLGAIALNVCEGKERLFFVIHMANMGARFPIPMSGSWVKSLGGLTPVGMRQLYLLGRELRKQYVEDNTLLDQQYNPHQLLIRATAYNRTTTLNSAYSFARGLYLPGTGYSLTREQSIRAVPPTNFTNYTEYQKELRNAALLNFFASLPVMLYAGGPDYVLSASTFCTKIIQMVQANLKKNEALKAKKQRLIERYEKSVFPELQKAFNNNSINDMNTALIFRDYIISAKYYAEDIHINLKEETMRELDEMYSFVNYEEYFNDPLVARVVSNGILEEIIKDLKDSLEESRREKRRGMITYIVHDTNIMALFRMLEINMTNGYVDIPYGSSLQIEIYENTEDKNLEAYKARIKYNGKALSWPKDKIEIRLNVLMKWLEESLVPNFQDNCIGASKKETEGSDGPWIVAGIIVGIIILIMIVITCVHVLKKTPEEEAKKNLDEEAKD